MYERYGHISELYSDSKVILSEKKLSCLYNDTYAVGNFLADVVNRHSDYVNRRIVLYYRLYRHALCIYVLYECLVFYKYNLNLDSFGYLFEISLKYVFK